MKKKILILTPYLPYPLYSGGNKAQFSMIDNLRNQYDISILFIESKVTEDAVLELKKRWSNVTFYGFKYESASLKIREKSIIKCKQLITKLYSLLFKSKVDLNAKIEVPSTLYSSLDFYFSPLFLNFVYDVSRRGFDVIQVEFFEFLPLVHNLPNDICRVFIHHEIRYIRNSLEMDLLNKHTTYDNYVFQLSKMFEINNLNLYDKIVTLSDTDRIKLLKELPDKEIISSPSFVQFEKRSNKMEVFHFKNKLVFLGSPSHFPNKDGLLWFLKNVWSSVSNLELHVIGGWKRNDLEDLVTLSDNVFIYPFIKDLSPILEGSILIVPIRIGSGIRIKILDAIDSNIPIITSSVGYEGLNLTDGEDCLVANSAEEFIINIKRLATDNSLQKKLIKNASTKLNLLFNRDSLLKQRIHVYES